jgi:5-(carboxyamino)imidazole ribonucleotide mutase
MPGGIPVGTLSIGASGAKNAALLAIAIVSTHRPALRDKLRQYRASQTDAVMKATLS